MEIEPEHEGLLGTGADESPARRLAGWMRVQAAASGWRWLGRRPLGVKTMVTVHVREAPVVRTEWMRAMRRMTGAAVNAVSTPTVAAPPGLAQVRLGAGRPWPLLPSPTIAELIRLQVELRTAGDARTRIIQWLLNPLSLPPGLGTGVTALIGLQGCRY